MGKGKIGGKYEGKTTFGHKHKINREWGTRHELHQTEWGQYNWFVGSGETPFNYIDPNTGTIITIMADNAKDAARQARNAGLIKKRKKR